MDPVVNAGLGLTTTKKRLFKVLEKRDVFYIPRADILHLIVLFFFFFLNANEDIGTTAQCRAGSGCFIHVAVKRGLLKIGQLKYACKEKL